MINNRIVGEIDSPHVSQMAVVKKKRSNCIYVAYRKLNQIIITDPWYITTAKDLFQKLRQCQLFSRIDLSDWQTPVMEDIHKTAFIKGWML